MSQLDMFPKPCVKCLPEFENLRLQSNNKYEAQRVRYCREFLRYQRENFAQRTEINALEVQLKHALEKLLKAERELIQAWKTSQQAEPLTDDVLVPLEVLEAVESSLDSFAVTWAGETQIFKTWTTYRH